MNQYRGFIEAFLSEAEQEDNAAVNLGILADKLDEDDDPRGGLVRLLYGGWNHAARLPSVGSDYATAKAWNRIPATRRRLWGVLCGRGLPLHSKGYAVGTVYALVGPVGRRVVAATGLHWCYMVGDAELARLHLLARETANHPATAPSNVQEAWMLVYTLSRPPSVRVDFAANFKSAVIYSKLPSRQTQRWATQLAKDVRELDWVDRNRP